MEIKINALTKRFGDKTAVDIPEFSVAAGETLGLVGNNGAGKTTLFRMMLDLVKADEGRIEYVLGDGTTINPARDEGWKDVTGAYIDEGFLIDFLTPEEYLEYVGKVNGLSRDDVAQRLKSTEDFAAGEIYGQHKFIRDLSAGNKQKVGIIAAMLGEPQVLILDEPFNFLDPSGQNILKRMLSSYGERSGATILVSSHNLQHTVEISSRVALMEHGRIIKDLPNVNMQAARELEDYFKV